MRAIQGRAEGQSVQLENRMKQLLRELGRAINEAVSDSDRISDTIARIKAHGYDVFLMLDAVVALNKRPAGEPAEETAEIASDDQRFLKSLKIRLDGEKRERKTRTKASLTITPQDRKFLKSLRINIDDLK